MSCEVHVRFCEGVGVKFPRATHLVVMVKSARAAGRVMASLIRFAEDKLKLVVNRAKSQATPLKACAFLGFQIGARVWDPWLTNTQSRGPD